MLTRIAAIILFGLLGGAICNAAGQPESRVSEVHRILADDRYEWVTLEGAHTRVHFPVGSFADGKRTSLTQRAEAARQRVLGSLEIEGYLPIIDIFYVDGRDDMAHLTGSSVTGFAYFRDDAVVLVFNDNWRAFECHEIAHVITFQVWGQPFGAASVEGIATYIDGECGGYEIGQVARTLLESGEMLDLQVLTEEFSTQDDLIAYAQAGAVVAFMYQRAGGSVIRTLWKGGLLAAPGLLGVSRSKFESEFQEWLLASYTPIPEADWQEIRSTGCGAKGDTPG